MKLEQQNFKIDSTGWTKKHDDYSGIDYLENPEGDVWEIASGEFKGEQLFTWDAAMRETKKAGKTIPTDKQWSKLLKTKSDMPNLKLAGYRLTDGSFFSLWASANFWSSSQSGTSAWNRYLGYGYATVYRGLYSKANGFSVRCIKDKQPRDSKGRFKGKYEKNLYLCQSYYDDNNVLRDCTCGKCGKDNITEQKRIEKIIKDMDKYFFEILEPTIIKKILTKENPSISIELQKLTYKLSQGDFSIYASVGKKGKITIKKPNGFMDFVFEKSDPKTVKAIGELLIKASEL